MTQKPETRLVNAIMAYLRTQKKSWWVKIHGGPYQVSGLPDIIGCYQGLFVAIEVKLPNKTRTVTRRQAEILRRIRRAGGIPGVVTSVQDAMNLLENIEV